MTGKIELKAFYGKQQGAFTACPVRDRNTGKLLGVENLTPEERFKHPRAVDEHTTRRISDGTIINLDDIIDATDWNWIKHNKEIAASWEDAINNPNALYYIFVPDKELEDRVKKKENVYEALKIVHEGSKVNREEIARLLGTNVSEFKTKEVLDFLIDKCEKNPEKVIEAHRDEFREQKMFLYGLLDNGLIKKDTNGTYRYGDIVMGLNLHAALNWLASNDNRQIVGRLYAKLNQTKVSIDAPVGSFLEDLKEEAKRISEQEKINTGIPVGETE